ncbi:MAG TPA: AAA family ATPase [Solirubrobacteraceae bacterium]|jgi:hypothetical protein|nr:AAA family ATPase [Solirubrobacteraceae bacterium]
MNESSTVPAAGRGPLVGRARELRELHEAFEDARRGRGGVHVVLGESGVGKTRLAVELADHAGERGARVIWTRGAGRGAPAYGPWAEITRALTQDLDGDQLRAELGRAAHELLRLTPELGDRLPTARPQASQDEDVEGARFALFDALGLLLRALSARRPLVVIVDDLQAVDEGSLIALDFVSRMLGDAAVMCVLTMQERAGDRTPEAQAALQNVVRSARRMVLGGLDRADVRRLVELTGGATADALADAVYDLTEGNPFFAGEVLALLAAGQRLHDPPGELPLSAGVRDTIARRLEPLGRPARETLELAAIIGRRFGLATLQYASPLAGPAVVGALDHAAQLGLVVPLPGALADYRFAHGLIRDTLVTGMPADRRRRGHRAVGEALERLHRGAIDDHLPELAHHFLSAQEYGDRAIALAYAERAARHALGRLAHEQAADLFAQAIEALNALPGDIPRRADLLLGLGTAQARAGRPAARETFEAAVAAARAIEADDILARAALGFSPFALTPGYVDEAHVALLVEALDRLGPGDAPLRVRLLAALAVALYWSDAAERRERLASEALEMARRLADDTTLAIALSSAQLATCGPDATERGLAWLAELFAISDRAGETVMSLAARSRHVDLLLELDELAAADIASETLSRVAREAGDPRAMAFAALHRARRAALGGRLDESQAMLDGVAQTAGSLAASTIPITLASHAVVLTWLRHGPREMLAQVRAYAAAAPAMPCWRAGLAAALADGGQVEEAGAELDRLAAGDFVALPRDNLWLAAMTLLCEAIAALERGDLADAVHAQLAPFAGRNVVLPTVAFLGPVELWLGILARVGGRDAQALEQLGAARVRARRDGARTTLARIAVEEAVVYVGDGGSAARRRAETLLDGAARECAAIGLIGLGERVAALRERLRAPVAKPGRGDGVALPDATLRRIGAVWTITRHGRTVHLNDGRGLRLIALLLERPGAELHSLDLVAAVDGAGLSDVAKHHSGGQETGHFGVQGGAGPALDARAKSSYRERIAELEAELANAVSRRDETAAARVGEELEFVRRELGRAVGIGGRDRETGSHAERARINVTRAIRATLKRIATYDAQLGAELERTVRTGTFCVYEPDRSAPARWTVDRR